MTVGLDRRVDVERFETRPGDERRRAGGSSAPSGHARPGRLRTGVLVLLAVQLAVMAVVSLVEYRRYALGVGFGTYSQAWTAIAHGHLDPVSSLIGKSFWRNDAELVLWPLALLYWVFPHPVTLLWVQDAALVAIEYVALGWMAEIVAAGLGADRRRRALVWGCVVVTVADPFLYYSAAYDFHSEILAALFVLLAARALWAGRHRQLWIVVPLGLATSGLSALYIAGVGVAGVLAGRRSRRAGAVVAAAALAWVVVVTSAGGAEFGYAHSLGSWYGYLVGPHHGSVTVSSVLGGALSHPVTAVHMLAGRWVAVLDLLLAAGLVGVVWPWAWPVAVVVIVPSALNANPAFVSPQAAFQNFAALPLVAVGSVAVMVRLLDRRAGGGQAAAAAALWVVGLVVLGATLFPRLPGDWVSVRPEASATLARVDAAAPANAEMIVSWGVAGRFATRADFRGYGADSVFPVDRSLVVFVFAPGQGIYGVAPAAARRAIADVRWRLHATVLAQGGGVEAFAWKPPAEVTSVTLPVSP